MTRSLLTGDYLGMALSVDAADHENQSFFRHCGAGAFRLQKCGSCDLFRYPPATGCPFCGHAGATWEAVEPRGTVFSYAEVPHPIQPAFRDHLPYMVVFVELDTQSGRPGPEDGLRVAGNLVQPDGALAPPDLVARVGIGSRMRMLFVPVGENFALPMWTLDETADQPATPWRYPE